MKHLSHAFVFLIVSCCVLGTASPAQTVVVSGRVSTLTTVVRNATVSFQETANPAHTYTTSTDSTGHYSLSITLTSVPQTPTLPTRFSLEQNYPNPFASSTAIPYRLSAPENVKVTIYDILGRVVRETEVGLQAAGTHSVLWDGRNNNGLKVVPGVYFYCLQAGGESQTMKLVMEAGANGLAPVPLNAPSAAPVESPSPRPLMRVALADMFRVNIDTTSGTSPLIVPTQIDSIVIQGDSTLDFVVDPQVPVPIVTVNADSVQQTIRGFGAANILPWRPDMTTDEVQKAFGTGPGQLGFTILRLRIPYSDDTTEFRPNVQTAKLAESLGAIVFASPWTPPPALKSSNNIVGGMLNDSSYGAYALHLKGFADFMANNGAPLYAVSLQNEPDANVTYESCSWNATQFVNFLKNNAASIGTRIMMPESQNFVHALSDSALNDPVAASNISIIAGHIYGGGLAPYPLAVSKGKDVWMTEHLVTDTTWTADLATGKEIHDCMNAGMNAYVWWYIVRFYGPVGEDGNVTKRGLVMSQYARFVRPGYSKVQCNPAPQRNVWVTAYKDASSSKFVIVVLNMGTSAVSQGFAVTHGTMSTFSVYTTSVSMNCVQGADISVLDGRFAATLPPSSITTFVSH